jgi:hypothetical protein
MRRTTGRPATSGRDEGLAETSMTATFTPTEAVPEPARTRIGQSWATCPCHAQDRCLTCGGSGVVLTPRIYTDNASIPFDPTINLTEGTIW